MYLYPKFYLAHGVRKLQQMMNPPMDLAASLLLPQNSIYHCTDYEEGDLGVKEDDEIVSTTKSDIVVEHVTELAETAKLGDPREVSVPIPSLLQQYYRDHKRFKRLGSNTSLMKNPRILFVYSYGMIDLHYRYIKHFSTPFNQWANGFITVIETINKITQYSDRQHFIQVHMPLTTPPLSWLQTTKKDFNQTIASRFNTNALRFIADLFKWIGPDRNLSFLSKLDKKALDKVNIIFLHSGQWTVLNLGIVDSWRQEPLTKEELDKLDANAKRQRSTQTPAEILERRFVRFLISINEAITTVDEIQSIETEEEQVLDEDEKERLLDDDLTDSGSDDLDQRIAEKLQTKKEETSGSLVDVGSKIKETDTDDDFDGTVDVDKEISDEDIDKDLKSLEEIAAQQEQAVLNKGSYKPYVPTTSSPEEAIRIQAETLARQGKLSAAELRALTQMATRYKSIKNPFNEKETFEQLAKIDPNVLVVPENNVLIPELPGVVDKSLLSSSIKNFDNKYIREVLQKDIAAAILNFQQAGLIIRDYKVHHIEDFTDSYYEITIDVVPLVGTAKPLKIKIPKVNENGQFKAAGVLSRMRKQRGDLPIRKTDPNTVALTSYYNKMFVSRSERSNFNYEKWLGNKITAIAIGAEASEVTEAKLADVFDKSYKLPRVYTIVAKKISSFKCKGFDFSFDWVNRELFFGKSIITSTDKLLEEKFMVPVAKSKDHILLLDGKGELTKISLLEKKESEKLGSFESFLDINTSSRPNEVAEVSLFGKEIPLGIVLGYEIGLGNLLETIKADYRRVAKGSHAQYSSNEFVIKFEDETLIIKRTWVSELILSGFNRFAKDIKRYSVYSFDQKEVYANVLESIGIGIRWIREFNILFKLWVDHITRDILIEMKEPTDLVSLFIRSAELLLTDQSPHEMDGAFMRDKGYERIAGIIYFEMVKAARGYVSKPATAKASMELNPQAVWMGILQDQSVMPVDENNPIHSLKEKEELMFGGAGGRTARSMTESARVFHKSSEGVVSEATKDSSDVATVVYTTANPNYTSLRGTTRRLDKYEGNSSKMLSTSALLAPGSQHDDPKRINFINIQNSQTTHCKHYTPMPARTGYERVLAHRTDELFAKTARTDGKVTNKSENVITVTYSDGEVVSYEIGRRFGRWGGYNLPHDIHTDLKVGDAVKLGTPIVYNKQFFERDYLDKNQVIYKTGILARTVLWEGVDTLEDSSALSLKLADKLVSELTEVRNIKVPFDLEVKNLIKPGTKVEPESILCRLHTVTQGNRDIFDEDALSVLDLLSSNSPKAKMTGVVDKIEVLYSGELENMSESLLAIAEQSDSQIRKFNKQLGKRATDGYVEAGYRVGGDPIENNTAIIRVYITGEQGMGVGDKAVFGNNLKTVICRIMNGPYTTEDGIEVDAIFGYTSIANRIVLSSELMGTTNTLCVLLGEKAVKLYRGQS